MIVDCRYCYRGYVPSVAPCGCAAEVEIALLKAALEPFAALLDPEEDWGAITIVDIGVRIDDVRRARDLLYGQQKAPPGGGAGGAGC
jgi:hypothetical protein